MITIDATERDRLTDQRVLRNEHYVADLDGDTSSMRDPMGSELISLCCECGEMDCQSVIHLTFDEYEEVRSTSSWLAVAVGHESRGFPRVVAAKSRFATVERP